MRTRTVFACGLLHLMVTTASAATDCLSEVLKTPAVYLEHAGDSDKPIFPIVIATKRPNEKELRCVIPDFWRQPGVFVVTDEELTQANTLVKHSAARKKGAAQQAEFRYILVSREGAGETGSLNAAQAKEALAALAAYFQVRQPGLYEQLTATAKRF